jgi:hypothetical protein
VTAPAANRNTTWYEPEFTEAHGTCYCRATAYGRTRYWTGHEFLFRYQCRDHLLAVGAVYEAVPR